MTQYTVLAECGAGSYAGDRPRRPRCHRRGDFSHGFARAQERVFPQAYIRAL